MPTSKVTIWISALIPQAGADTYDGVRVQASLTEEDCYRDLAEWLELDYEGVVATAGALDESAEIQLWKVEEQTIHAIEETK